MFWRLQICKIREKEKYYGYDADVKIIVDTSLDQGGIMVGEKDIVMFPTQAAKEAGIGNIQSDDFGMIGVEQAIFTGYKTPEDVISSSSSTYKQMGASETGPYFFSSGGIDWLCQDYILSSYSIHYASAVVEENCYIVYCIYNSSNEESVKILYKQILNTVRPI